MKTLKTLINRQIFLTSNIVVRNAFSNFYEKKGILKEPSISHSERKALSQLQLFCNIHHKMLFFGIEEISHYFSKHLKSICIDDVTIIGKVLCKNLGGEFINPLTSQLTLRQLIHEIEAINPNIIYLDWDLGNVFDDNGNQYNGGSIANEIKKIHPNIYIILITGANREDVENRIKNPDIDGLLVFKKNLDMFIKSYSPSLLNNFNRSEIYQVYSLSNQIALSSISISKKNDDLDQKQKDSIELPPREPDSPKPSRPSINYGRKVLMHQPLKVSYSTNCSTKCSTKCSPK